MMDETLRRLQLTQLEMLKVYDHFCRKHGLHYSLYAGTLLGAVRHRAFIPWDDDLDVCMSREEYDRFLSLWAQEPPAGYLLQNKENAPRFSQSFSKIRKDHTTFLQEGEVPGAYHTGIFIDIFPIDRIPNGEWQRRVFRWNCMKYQLLTREFVPPKWNTLVKVGSSVILACVPRGARQDARQKLLQQITKHNDRHELETVMIETVASMQKPQPADLLDSYVELPFEDGSFMCFAKWKEYLCRKFGDYMQLPPEEERAWKHRPIVIDFERNVTEISEHV